MNVSAQPEAEMENRLSGEAFTTGTMRDSVRICYFKAALLQVVAEIQHGAANK